MYPPMSTLLEKQGIELIQGYDASQLDPQPDLVIIGNAMTRGNPCVEAVLKGQFLYVRSTVAARFCAARPLGAGRCRYTRQNHHRGNGGADCGTVWLQTGLCNRRCAGNFEVSARLGESDFFVIEAVGSDCAFFDKRSEICPLLPAYADPQQP